MKILFADSLPEIHLDRLRKQGDDCVVRETLDSDDLPQAISGYDILVVRSTKVTTKTIAASDQLGLIVRSGAGTNTIDCESAASSGIYVCNVPGTNSLAVAELTMGLLLAVDRQIPQATVDLRNGLWNKNYYGKADGLFGKTLGIIGVGEIGLALADRAKAFGITVLAERKPGRSPEIESRIRSSGIKLVDGRDELLDQSDIVSLHVPGGDSTNGMVNAKFLRNMKPNAILLNTSRGEVINESDLIVAMNEQGIRAGLDVFCHEPHQGKGEFISEIAQHPNVVATHHIGASTQQAQNATAAGAIEVIEAYKTGELLNCVNLSPTRIGSSTIIIRHFDKIGVLASALEVIRSADLNVQTMENRVFQGAKAAIGIIDVVGDVTEQVIQELADLKHVIQVQASDRVE